MNDPSAVTPSTSLDEEDDDFDLQGVQDDAFVGVY